MTFSDAKAQQIDAQKLNRVVELDLGRSSSSMSKAPAAAMYMPLQCLGEHGRAGRVCQERRVLEPLGPIHHAALRNVRLHIGEMSIRPIH